MQVVNRSICQICLTLPNLQNATALKCGSFLKKNIEKRHLCGHDKNYYYFCKSNIIVINLIVGSTNMIKVSKNMSL